MRKVPVHEAINLPSPSLTLASTVALRRVRWTTSAAQVIFPSFTGPKKWTSSPMVAVLRPTRAAAESLIVLSMSEATPPCNAPFPFKWTFSTSMWQAALPPDLFHWLLM
jgi:hypothetical protein